MIVMNDVWRQSQLEMTVVKIVDIRHHVMVLSLTDDGRDYSRPDRDQILSRWER